MKNKLDKMNYKEFKEYLNRKNIKFKESEDSEIPFDDTIEICPISKKLKSRTFYIDNGEQTFKEEGIFIERELDQMDYIYFMDYLNNMNVKYDEIRGQSYFDGFYIRVIPISKIIKPRNFYCSSYTQKLENPDNWHGCN